MRFRAVVDERKPGGERHLWNSSYDADDIAEAIYLAMAGYDQAHIYSVEVERAD